MSRRPLRSVSAAPLRAVGYIRVSKERADMISPELQETAIRDHCARHGYVLVGLLTDLDLTGRFWKRRQVEQGVKMIEDDEAEVLVVWKISRVARNRLDWNIAVDRVESVGGRLESATEPVDATTSTGRFTRGMLAELAAFESEVKGEQWKEAQARRRGLGLPHSGGYRPGYTYADKRYEPDPAVAPFVAAAYERFVAGMGTLKLAEWMRAVGIPCRVADAQWTYRGAQRMLDSGWAAGLLHVHDPACGCANKSGACDRRVHIRGAHEPIISDKLWKAYLAERARRTTTPRRLLSPSTPLSGLVRCAACGYGMRLKNGPRGGGRLYACTHRGCARPTTVVVSRAEAAARGWLDEYARDVEAQADLSASRRTAQVVAKAAVTRLARTVNQLETELGKLTREYTRGVIPEGAYSTARDELLAEITAAQGALAETSAQVGLRRPSPRAVADMLADWELYDVADRNRICRDLLRVVAGRGAYRSVLEVVPSWEWRPPGSEDRS